MTVNTDAHLAEATTRLARAAHLAAQRGTAASDALAAQIRLARATLTTAPPEEASAAYPESSVLAELHGAVDALDRVEPLDGPPELLLVGWNIAELIRLVHRDHHSR